MKDVLKQIFYNLIVIHGESPARAYIIISVLVVIGAMLVWVSVLDIKRRSVTFWKMLLASSSTILGPFLASFMCDCWKLKLFILASIPLWFVLLAINIKYNHEKFVGKADLDLLSALFAECVTFSLWMLNVMDPSIVWIQITHLWYTMFLYLLIGSLAFIIIFMVVFMVMVAFRKRNIRSLTKSMKISVIPMIMPAAWFVPYTIMTVSL